MIELGSFDAAAERLHVTPSAVSQRIKALEQRVGQVLVVREKPCTATAAGIPLLRLAAQTALLEAEALAEMGGGGGAARELRWRSTTIRLATWFTGVFSALDDVLFDIRIEDQDHSARLLREGAVLGAVTTERHPVPGCRVQPLGVMRYVPVASADYIKRHLPDSFTAHAVAESVVAGVEPRRCAAGHVGAQGVSPRHQTDHMHYRSNRGGLLVPRCAPGWGGACSPKSLAAPALKDGSFVRVCDTHLDVPLGPMSSPIGRGSSATSRWCPAAICCV